MLTKRPPRDVNELARYVLEVTTGDEEKIEPPQKNLTRKPYLNSEQARAAKHAR